MTSKYIQRSIEPVLLQAVGQFPAVVLTGPRQAGKTTVLRKLLGDKFRYVSLELPDVRAAALSDPRGFLAAWAPPVILDEIQHAPGLLPYIKADIDENRQIAGRYVLSGSQNLLLMEQVTETLAGRTAILRLMPLSLRELQGTPARSFAWELAGEKPETASRHIPFWNFVLTGGYPELWASSKRSLDLWFGAYTQTYLERDVRTLRQIGDLTQFQGFLRTLAARSTGLLNLARLAGDLGIALNTAKAWLSVLEATHQVVVVRPYFANVGKRLVKTPRVLFTDTGLLCHLVGLKTAEHSASGPMAGALMQTAVFGELYKNLLAGGQEPRIYFWRTSAGTEVDFIVEVGQKLIPIEVKVSATPTPRMARAIAALQADLPDRVSPGFVVHPGNTALPLVPGVSSLPFARL